MPWARSYSSPVTHSIHLWDPAAEVKVEDVVHPPDSDLRGQAGKPSEPLTSQHPDSLIMAQVGKPSVPLTDDPAAVLTSNVIASRTCPNQVKKI